MTTGSLLTSVKKAAEPSPFVSTVRIFCVFSRYFICLLVCFFFGVVVVFFFIIFL